MDTNDSKPQQTGGLKLMTVFIAVLALHVLVIGGFTVYHLMGSGSDADLAQDKTHKLKADGTAVADTSAPDAAASDKTADTATATPSATETSGTSASTAATTSPATPATGTTSPAATTPAPAPSSAPAVADNPPATPEPPKSAATAPTTPATTARSPIVLSSDDMAQASTIPPGLAPPPDAPASAPAADSAAAPAPAVASTPKPSAVLGPIMPAKPVPAPVPDVASSATPTGPVALDEAKASGPVHMPKNGPKPPATTSVASAEEHASTPSHEPAHAAPHEAKHETYTVKITDSFKKIARAHHVSVAQLKEANHLKGDTLHAGQKLIIPAAKTSVAKSEAPRESEMKASLASLSASPELSATGHKHFYTVSKGDTLAYIAKKCDVSVSALKEVNGVASTKQLKVGEKLRIPSRESRSASITPAAPAPAAPAPSQVVTQPEPVAPPAPPVEPSPAPPMPTTEPQPTAGNPALANLTF